LGVNNGTKSKRLNHRGCTHEWQGKGGHLCSQHATGRCDLLRVWCTSATVVV
jgi:hypothetical protein